MSTLSDQIAAQRAAKTSPVKKTRKKKTAKRDEQGRFVKQEDADLTTPSY